MSGSRESHTDATELRRALASAVLASSPAHGKTALDGKPTAYVCIGPQCSLPVTEPAALVETAKAARQVAIA